MSAMIPPGRWDDPAHDVERLREALQGHDLTPSHEDALTVIAGCGHEHTMAVIGLLDMVATGPASVPCGDPHLAEGLPSYMSVGVSQGPPAEPWWHCARCAHTMRNLHSTEHARVWAAEHARTRHGGDPR